MVSVRDSMAAISRLRGGTRPHLSGAAERLVVTGNERRCNPAQRREASVESAFAGVLVAYGGSGGARQIGDPNGLLSVQVQQPL